MKCENCDRPLATKQDAKDIPPGEGEHLCWGACEPEDWRARAILAETALEFLRCETCNCASLCACVELFELKRERDAALQALNGTAVFIGPCAHERDPWDRCDECAEDNALWAATKAVTARTRERDEARAEVERLRSALKLLWEEATDESRCAVERSTGDYAHQLSTPCRELVRSLVTEGDK